VARIIFCEDEPSIQKLIRAALRSSGHEIEIAANGSEGLALIERNPPDVVFTDIAMPVMDGYQLWNALSTHPDLCHIPVVVLTASVQPYQLKDMRDRGLIHYLAKPFKTAELRAKVDEMVNHVSRAEPTAAPPIQNAPLR
jgi:CheY-like chemotaxis protein